MRDLILTMLFSLASITSAYGQVSADSISNSIAAEKQRQQQVQERVVAAGGQIIKHAVQRGEDFESIATRYSAHIDDIRALNPSYAAAYVGTQLNIPMMASSTSVGTVSADVNFPIEVDPRYDQAMRLINSGENKKAVKIYSQIIKEGRPQVSAYIGRGMAYYNLKKYNHAIKDLDHAHTMTDGELSKSILAFRKQAQKAKNARAERRGRFWNNLFATSAQIAVGVINAKQQTEMAKYSGSGVSTDYASNNFAVGGRSSDLNYLLDPRYTVMQVNAQHEEEYQMMRSANPTLTREEYWQLKVAAYTATKQAITGGGGVSSNYNKKVPNNSHTCSLCNGTGNISKETYPASFGYADHTKEKCNTCGQYFPRSSGHVHITCPNCHGKCTF